MRIRTPWVILVCLLAVQTSVSLFYRGPPDDTNESTQRNLVPDDKADAHHLTLKTDKPTASENTHESVTDHGNSVDVQSENIDPAPNNAEEKTPVLPDDHPHHSHVHQFPPIWDTNEIPRWTPRHKVHDKSKPPDHPYGFQDRMFKLKDKSNNTVSRRNLTVLWHFQPSRVVESHFQINYLLSGLGRLVTSIIDVEHEEFHNDSIIITGFETDKTKQYLAEFRKRGFVNVGVLLMAQEYNGKDRHSLADYTDYHLRIYYFPEDVKELGGYGDHVIWIPNGFKDGIGLHRPDMLTPAHERNSTCGFTGDVKDAKPWRKRALAVVEEKMGDRCHIRRVIGFGGDLGPKQYAAFMEDNIFSLVLDGNNPETIRLYDSLEMGMIPVLVEHPYLNACFKGHPFLYVKEDWSDIDQVLEPYLKNATLTRQLQISVMHYWQEFVYEVRSNVTKRVDRAFRDVYGIPC